MFFFYLHLQFLDTMINSANVLGTTIKDNFAVFRILVILRTLRSPMIHRSLKPVIMPGKNRRYRNCHQQGHKKRQFFLHWFYTFDVWIL